MLKKYWHRHAYKKSLKRSLEERSFEQRLIIQKIRILLDGDLEVERDFFMGFAQLFSIAQFQVSIMVFSSGKELDKEYFRFFDEKEISFFGSFKNDLASFCSKEVDLQLNYFNKKDQYMHWVAVESNKKFSIGFTGANVQLNDLVLDLSPSDKTQVRNEIIKYLKILKIL